MHLTRVVVGRQAIQDRQRQVVGYELLFRSTPSSADGVTSDQMTADVVFGALNIGLTELVYGQKIFCNADRAVLVGDLPLGLPPEQTVLEVLETVSVDDEVLTGCRRLVDEGFQLAVDDFVWFDGAERLLELATVVKLDVQQIPADELPALMERCRPFGVQLLAEKVETEAEYLRCLDAGFDLFQGYHFERPVIVAGRTIEAGDATRLRTASVLLERDMELDALDDMLRADPGLAFQIIQLASLGRVGETRRTVNTTRDAIVLMGPRRVQNWLALLLARPSQPSVTDGFDRTLMRARACEILAGSLDPGKAPVGFAAGLLSSFDLLFGVSPDQLLRVLPVGDELAAAAFGEATELACIVRDAVDYQLGRPARALRSRLDRQQFDDAFATAFLWMVDVSRSTGPEHAAAS